MTLHDADLDLQRRFFAEEIEAVCRLRTPALVDALAAVPRERFLPPGPWTVIAESELAALTVAMSGKGASGPGVLKTQTTVDAEPRRVYHNIAVAIDPSRQLFNGQPATLASWLDALDLAPGKRVLHVGTGLGYYTAVMAHAVGPTGLVFGYDVDDALAAAARRNAASMPWLDIRHGDASADVGGPFDAIVVNAGVTHPLDAWLDALAPGGRMILPVTAEMPPMGSTIGKGLVLLLTRNASGIAARMLSFVAVYSAVGIRDASLNAAIGKALMAGPAQWQAITRLRRDPHEAAPSCWLHLPNCCFAA